MVLPSSRVESRGIGLIDLGGARFTGTNLQDILTKLGAKQLVLTGYMAHGTFRRPLGRNTGADAERSVRDRHGEERDGAWIRDRKSVV